MIHKKLGQKGLKILVGISVTSLALWLSFRKLDWEALKATFFQVNFIWVILAFANTIFIVYALGWRWRIFLKPKGRIPLKILFRLNVISQYTNILAPARFGEVVRAYLASKKYNVSGAYVMATVVIEKILDFLVFVALWITVPTLLAIQKGVKGYRISLFFSLLLICFLVLFVWKPKTFLKWMSYFSRLLPKSLREKIINFSQKGIEAFSLLRNTKTLLLVVSLTFGFIIGEVLTNFFLFKAFNLNLSFWAALFVLLAIQVGNIPPSVPGKIGVFEFAAILALSVFGIPKNLALSYGLMLHVVAYLPKILLGTVFITGMDISLKKGKDKLTESGNNKE